MARALETLFAAILLGILAAVGVKLAAAGITLAEAAFVGLWTAAGVLLVVSQYQQIRKRARKKRLANRTSEEVATQILNWMHKHHYGIKSLDPAPEHLEFKIRIDFKPGLPITVLKTTKPWMSFVAKILVDPIHQAALAQRTAVFAPELVLHLVPLRLAFRIVMNDADTEIEAVALEHSALFDEIANDLDCLRALQVVESGALAVAAMVTRVTEIAKLKPASAGGAP